MSTRSRQGQRTHEGDEGPVDERPALFWNGGGERSQPRLLAAREDQSACIRPRPRRSWAPLGEVVGDAREASPAARRRRGPARCAVDRQSAAHAVGGRPESSSPELGAIRDEHDGVGARTAASAESTRSRPGRAGAPWSATGSYARTFAPAACKRAARTSEDAAHVVGVRLERQAEQRDSAPGEVPRPPAASIMRRFCSSSTSITASSSGKW